MSRTRIDNEYLYFLREDHPRMTMSPMDENKLKWSITLIGPPKSYYENGIFWITVQFDKLYPFTVPKILFKTKIFHPQITENQHFFLEMTCPSGKGWSYYHTIINVVKLIDHLLKHPDLREIQNKIFMRKINSDFTIYEKIAREWTRHYAM